MVTDPRPTATLIEAALRLSQDDHHRWDLVVALHFRGTAEVFDAAAALCSSALPLERLLGVDVLGQLGVESRPFQDQAVPILVDRLGDPDDEVAAAAGAALGHHQDLRAVDALVGIRRHPNAEVRLGVVHGLSELDDPRAIEALIELTRDESVAVRDWAVFGLGSQIDADTPELRDALLARARDPDPDTRGEALVGLARRGDPRVREPLQEALAEPDPGPLVIEAAAYFPGT